MCVVVRLIDNKLCMYCINAEDDDYDDDEEQKLANQNSTG